MNECVNLSIASKRETVTVFSFLKRMFPTIDSSFLNINLLDFLNCRMNTLHLLFPFSSNATTPYERTTDIYVKENESSIITPWISERANRLYKVTVSWWILQHVEKSNKKTKILSVPTLQPDFLNCLRSSIHLLQKCGRFLKISTLDLLLIVCLLSVT